MKSRKSFFVLFIKLSGRLEHVYMLLERLQERGRNGRYRVEGAINNVRFLRRWKGREEGLPVYGWKRDTFSITWKRRRSCLNTSEFVDLVSFMRRPASLEF